MLVSSCIETIAEISLGDGLLYLRNGLTGQDGLIGHARPAE